MTELLYQNDSYLRKFDATVIGIHAEENGVMLDRTAFYPGGGGQPNDTGTIISDGSQSNVKAIKRIDSEYFHILDGLLPTINMKINGEIDWERRYQLMRTHSALHVLCGVIWRDYRMQVTSASMKPLKGRLDFEFETLHGNLIQEIEAKINREVENKREIKICIKSRKEAFSIPDLIRTKINLLPESLKQIRIVEIEGLDIQADGGTHVANTKEIGPIKITYYHSKGRINKRIEIGLQL